jgi:2-polyprenyl-6-hydroxyphenyl methylase/3-demethylubiquinone-9 3-methyltransferase
MLRKDLRRASPIAGGTADPTEIARFDALAEEWWKPDGAFKVIHAFNCVRVAKISDRLLVLFRQDPNAAKPLTGLKIIDVGCGAGLVTEPLSQLGAEVLGIDAAERNVAIAERHARMSGAPVKYRHALPEDCADQEGAFDVVMSLEVVEHVADLPAFLPRLVDLPHPALGQDLTPESLTRLVAPGGILLIGTINRSLCSYFKAIIGAEYVLGWLPRGTHDWRKFVTPAELDAGLRCHGLSVAECWGIAFNPLTMCWGVSRDLSTNYLQFHRKN